MLLHPEAIEYTRFIPDEYYLEQVFKVIGRSSMEYLLEFGIPRQRIVCCVGQRNWAREESNRLIPFITRCENWSGEMFHLKTRLRGMHAFAFPYTDNPYKTGIRIRGCSLDLEPEEPLRYIERN
jgi:hypothetical protein